MYAVARNGKEYEQQAKQQACHAEKEGADGLAESVQDAVEHTGDVHERAQKTERQNKAARQLRVEEQAPGKSSEEQKQRGEEKAQQEAEADGGEDGAPHRRFVATGVRLGHNGQKQYGDGIGDGGGKQN